MKECPYHLLPARREGLVRVQASELFEAPFAFVEPLGQFAGNEVSE